MSEVFAASGRLAVGHIWITIASDVRLSIHSGGSCLVEVKYHQRFDPNESLGVKLYLTGWAPATLPLDHASLTHIWER